MGEAASRAGSRKRAKALGKAAAETCRAKALFHKSGLPAAVS